jgi:hypothetical protein
VCCNPQDEAGRKICRAAEALQSTEADPRVVIQVDTATALKLATGALHSMTVCRDGWRLQCEEALRQRNAARVALMALGTVRDANHVTGYIDGHWHYFECPRVVLGTRDCDKRCADAREVIEDVPV